MANFFVVFNRREQNAKQVENREFAEGKLLPQKLPAAGLGGTTGQLEDACVLKVEAATLPAAQRTVQAAYPGLQTGIPVVVTEAQFKEI